MTSKSKFSGKKRAAIASAVARLADQHSKSLCDEWHGNRYEQAAADGYDAGCIDGLLEAIETLESANVPYAALAPLRIHAREAHTKLRQGKPNEQAKGN